MRRLQIYAIRMRNLCDRIGILHRADVLVVIVFHTTTTSSLSYCHISACLSAIIIIGVQLIPMPVWDNNQ